MKNMRNMSQRSPPTHSFTHNCKVMRQNHKRIWSQIFALAALHCNQNTQTHTSTLLPLQINHNPQVNEAHNISRNTVRFHPNDKVENKTPTGRETRGRSLSLFFLPCLKLESNGRDPSASRPLVIGCRLRSITWWRRSFRQ